MSNLPFEKRWSAIIYGKTENTPDIYKIFSVYPKYLLEYIEGDCLYRLLSENIEEIESKLKQKTHSSRFYMYDYEEKRYKERFLP